MSPEQIVAELRRVAETDPDALGFAVAGSRAVGLATPESDHDCALVVRDGAGDAFRARYADLPRGVDLRIYTLSEFRAHAAWGSDTAWDRYTWTSVRFDPDRTGGELQRIADEKGRVPAEAVAPLVEGALDGYLNQVYRSVKCLRAGDRECAVLEAAASVRPLLQALFAVHGRREVPYYKYLRRELERAPLHKLALGTDELMAALLAVTSTADAEAQRRLLDAAERLFRAEGFGRRFDEWDTATWPARLFGAA